MGDLILTEQFVSFTLGIQESSLKNVDRFSSTNCVKFSTCSILKEKTKSNFFKLDKVRKNSICGIVVLDVTTLFKVSQNRWLVLLFLNQYGFYGSVITIKGYNSFKNICFMKHVKPQMNFWNTYVDTNRVLQVIAFAVVGFATFFKTLLGYCGWILDSISIWWKCLKPAI